MLTTKSIIAVVALKSHYKGKVVVKKRIGLTNHFLGTKFFVERMAGGVAGVYALPACFGVPSFTS